MVYVVRAPENRFHSSSSVARSIRGSAFQVSSRSRIRLTPLRQSDDAASFSASATIGSFCVLVSASCWARSALRASPLDGDHRAEGVQAGHQGLRSPTALASVTWSRTVLTVAMASSGESFAARTRCSSRPTSNSSAANRSV